MKLLYKKQRNRQIKIQYKRLRFFTKKKLIIKRKKRKQAFAKSRPSWWDKSILAPRIFSIWHEPARTELIKFLDLLRKHANREKTKIRLDFCETIHMNADATLLFKATLMHLKEKSANTVIKCAPSKNQKINEVLTQISVLKLLGQDFNITPHFEDVIYWRATEGKGSDGEKSDPILQRCDQVMNRVLSREVYVGLTEAMTNTRQHAYDTAYIASTNRTEWWIFAQEKDNELTIAICDLGIGIPTSLPHKKTGIYEWILKRGKPEKESELIAEAIHYQITRTRRKNQGKGLTQLTQVIDKAKNAAIYIHSNHGCYAKYSDKTELKDYDTSVGGTVITWRLPLSEGATPQ